MHNHTLQQRTVNIDCGKMIRAKYTLPAEVHGFTLRMEDAKAEGVGECGLLCTHINTCNVTICVVVRKKSLSGCADNHHRDMTPPNHVKEYYKVETTGWAMIGLIK